MSWWNLALIFLGGMGASAFLTWLALMFVCYKIWNNS